MGPQVKRLMKSDSFSEKLSAVERRGKKSFVSVVKGFLGNHKADNFREIVDAYEKMSCRMSPKLHALHSLIDEFKDNMGELLCTNQQPPQRGGAVPDPVWVESKWLFDFPRVPVTSSTPLHFFAMLHPERPQKSSTQHLQNRSPVFSFFSPALLCLFLLLFLLMSGNVHPNPAPSFLALCALKM